MLPAVHLLIGVTLGGIFLLYLTRDCRALIYCALAVSSRTSSINRLAISFWRVWATAESSFTA
ncbi:hypothetical protein [Methanogenium cariaci]|uniref:hypothetical protein n=1 Tax=Methanogenium cariaci TaxID=2197 RepID=UPI001FE07F2F|nr:hypothetical protein [Methanogenium cariaci]